MSTSVLCTSCDAVSEVMFNAAPYCRRCAWRKGASSVANNMTLQITVQESGDKTARWEAEVAGFFPVDLHVFKELSKTKSGAAAHALRALADWLENGKALDQ